MAKDGSFNLVGFPSTGGDDDASSVVDLGAYIFATNPYYAVPPPKCNWTKPYPPPVITIKDDYEADDVLYALDSTGIEQHQKPGTWKFKYADHYVDRALRIPYMYYVKSERTEGDDNNLEEGDQIVLVRDYILIGFEGGAGY